MVNIKYLFFSGPIELGEVGTLLRIAPQNDAEMTPENPQSY
jgi:hypothetical protein